MPQFRSAIDRLITLLMGSWGWLTPRARLYKVAAWTVAVLLFLALLDQAFVLPRMEGWLGALSLAGALTILGWMFARWSDEESGLDMPREWIAPLHRHG